MDYLPDKTRSFALRLFDVWEVALRNWRICHAEEELRHRGFRMEDTRPLTGWFHVIR